MKIRKVPFRSVLATVGDDRHGTFGIRQLSVDNLGETTSGFFGS